MKKYVFVFTILILLSFGLWFEPETPPAYQLINKFYDGANLTSNITQYWNTSEGMLDNVIDINTSWLTNDIGWSTYNSSDFDIDFLSKSTDDLTQGSTNLYSITPEKTIKVKAGVTVVPGVIYNTVADAITYINTQIPSIVNQWVIKSLDSVNTESFTLPNYVQIIGDNGFAGITTTIFTGDIVLGEYSILNSIYTTGQITAGSNNAAAPSIVFGSYMAGTLILSAGTYFQPVNTLLQLTGDLEVNGQLQVIGGTWLANDINVNAGGIFVGYIDMFSGTVVSNGGTIIANSYGSYFDGSVSGYSSDTIGDAIDELTTAFINLLGGKVPYTGATANVNLGAFDLTTTGLICDINGCIEVNTQWDISTSKHLINDTGILDVNITSLNITPNCNITNSCPTIAYQNQNATFNNLTVTERTTIDDHILIYYDDVEQEGVFMVY